MIYMTEIEELRQSGKFSPDAKFMEMSASCEVNVSELLQQFLFSGENKSSVEEVQNEYNG